MQDIDSLELLKASGIEHCSVSGDTRFDRVKKIAGNVSEIPLLKEFIRESKVVIAGSTWNTDEEILAFYVKNNPVKIVIAPHEIKKVHIQKLQQSFPDCLLYSELKELFAHTEVQTNSIWHSINEQQEKDLQKKLANARTLIIDSLGLLSKIYYYATVTYVGGGFKSGIHNTLEAVVYGKPVLFGPKYQKFKEAKDLIKKGAAFSISNAGQLKIEMDHLLNDPSELSKAGDAAKDYVEKNIGATQKIIQFIQENRLLTN